MWVMKVLCLASSLLFLLWRLAIECREQQQRYASARPLGRSIPDEEFVAASGARNANTALRIRQIIAQHLDIPENQIHPDDRFRVELGA
ncbi:MAG: hypothetical protein R3C49_07800 [Planctomycetaceae bacterium]